MLFVSGYLVVKGANGILAGGVLDGVNYGYACNLAVLSLEQKVVLRKCPLEVGLRCDVIKPESLATPFRAMRLDKGFEFREEHQYPIANQL